MKETASQRRAREGIDDVRALEKTTRALVEAEQLVAHLRTEQTTLRDRVLNVVGGRRQKIRLDIPVGILDTARAVEAGAAKAADVAKALGITAGCARMRLRRALAMNLVEQATHGSYYTPGGTERNETKT